MQLKPSHSSGVFNITLNIKLIYVADDNFNAGSTYMFSSCTRAYSKPQSTKSFSSEKQDKDLQIYHTLSVFLACFRQVAMRTF